MSPYPAQVERRTIISTARALIEAEGLDQLSLGRLAARLGIKAPSLYKHIASKAELIREVNTLTNRELTAALVRAIADARDDPRTRVLHMMHAYRAFALANPATYSLAYSNLSSELRPDAAEMEHMALPLQRLMAEIAGEADSLAALRGGWALVHGYVMLELNGHFRRGGDLEATYLQVIERYIAGWQRGERS